MSHVEERMVGRWSGPKFIIGSLAIGLLGVLPLLLYIAFGPADGNPIGLGLLAVLTIPVAGILLLVGLVKTAVEYFVRGPR
jgi:hypothetical protein